MKLGTVKQAQDIRSERLNLLNEGPDVQWVLELYGNSISALGITDVASVLIVGNEDAPYEVWVSNRRAPYLDTEYQLIYSEQLACHRPQLVETLLRS